MEKRLGKKVYRKMPTMQVMTGCLCITVCNDAGVDMGQICNDWGQIWNRHFVFKKKKRYPKRKLNCK